MPVLSEPRRLSFLILHSLQLLFVVIILGLSAYGVRYVAYNVLIYSLMVAITTRIMSTGLLLALSVFWIFLDIQAILCIHTCMPICWIVDLALVTELAKFWQQPHCTYRSNLGYQCTPLRSRDMQVLLRRKTTMYNTYSGVLIAGAILTAFEVIPWVTNIVIVINDLKRRSLTSSQDEELFSQEAVARSMVAHTRQQTLAAEIWDQDYSASDAHRPGPEPMLPDNYDNFSYPQPPSAFAPLRVVNHESAPQLETELEMPRFSIDMSHIEGDIESNLELANAEGASHASDRALHPKTFTKQPRGLPGFQTLIVEAHVMTWKFVVRIASVYTAI